MSQPTLSTTGATSAINSAQFLPFLQNHRVIFRGIASILLIEQFSNERDAFFVADPLNDCDDFFARETFLPAGSSSDRVALQVADKEVAINFLGIATNLTSRSKDVVVSKLGDWLFDEDLQ